MELDKRIIEGKKPLTCFDVEQAKEFLGKECYFSNTYCAFEDLHKIPKAELQYISNDKDASDPYKTACYYYPFCLPCEWVKEEKKEPKYRPYTKNEFLNMFECGKPINIRHKDDHINVFIETMSSVRIDNFMDEVHVRLYEGIVDLQKLFDEFEWQKSNGEWQPFGVIDEEGVGDKL